MPGDGQIPAKAVQDMIRTAVELRDNPNVLADVEKAANSCVKWARVLESLFEPDTLNPLFARSGPYREKVQMEIFNKIEQDLRDGKAIFAHVWLPGGGDHAFTIVGDGDKARVLHAWQDQHDIRAERSKPIKEMVSLLSELEAHDDISNDVSEILGISQRLKGSDQRDNDNDNDIKISPTKKRIIFKMITSAVLKTTLNKWNGRLRTFSQELSDWQGRAPIRARHAAGFGAALGFVLGAGGALISKADFTEVIEEGLKTGLGFGVGEGVATMVGKAVTPGITRAGVSVVRANAAAGIAMFAVFTLWDVGKWAMHEITTVQLRKKFAEGAAGAAGGIAGGIAFGALGGVALGPVGAIAGGILGGFIGGLGGAFAGAAIDTAIWDKNEDLVMDSYEFFGWHDVRRGQRPPKSAEEITAAYTRMLNKKPSPQKLEDKEWAEHCSKILLVLLQAMYPEINTLLRISEFLRNNSSKAVSIIGSTMYSSTSVSID